VGRPGTRDVTSRAAPIAALAAVALLAGDALADKPRAPSTVQDLAYGEVLFHFYQQDYFGALVRLLAAFERNEVPSHAAEAELLLGGLYLSYGQHRLAGEIFERMLDEHDDPALRDRAWFFLGKIWRQRGYFAEAEQALARIGGTLPPELEPERRLLAAQLAMDQGKFAEAEALLSGWRERDEWSGYARFNLGVALVRLGQTSAGAAMLEQVGTTPFEPRNETGNALRDRANVALGYAWLQAGEPALAKPALQRVRLSGPFSTKALLGVGWADSARADHRAALVPWLELKGRSLLDPAVQESLLAVPYAFAELGADRQAADHYLEAIDAFDAEIARIERSIAAVRSGALLETLVDSRQDDASGWYWRLDAVPDSAESRYLYELLSTHGFQEALKNYRDLQLLIRNLDAWSASLGAFEDILDTRRRAFEQRLPPIEERLEAIDLERLGTRRVELEAEVAHIERTRDYAALGSADQQRLWDELSALEPDLARLGNDAEAERLRGKQRFLKGILAWELERDFRFRLWQQKMDLRQLDLSLKEAQARRYRILAAKEAWPEQHAELTARIAALEARVAALQSAAHDALGRQQRFVEALAIDELEARRQRLAAYRVQARFSLAALYDRASSRAAVMRRAEGLE